VTLFELSMTPSRFSRYHEVLKKRQPDLTVVTDEVHKPRNLSAIIRTCDAVGIHRVHVAKPDEGYKAFRGTAKGSHRWVKVNTYDDAIVPLEQLKQQGHKIYAAHFSAQAVDFRTVDYTVPCAVLMGAEKEGVSAEALKFADREIIIPMSGMVQSYNVSSAATVILVEAQRQREAAGLYGTRVLSEDEYRRTFFQWAHPKLADYCHQKGIEYPDLDEEGEVKDSSQLGHMADI